MAKDLTAERQDAIKAAMIEELGIARVDTLPLENATRNHSIKAVGKHPLHRGCNNVDSGRRAKNSGAYDGLGQVWRAAISEGKFHDDDYAAVKDLDDLGGGRSYERHDNALPPTRQLRSANQKGIHDAHTLMVAMKRRKNSSGPRPTSPVHKGKFNRPDRQQEHYGPRINLEKLGDNPIDFQAMENHWNESKKRPTVIHVLPKIAQPPANTTNTAPPEPPAASRHVVPPPPGLFHRHGRSIVVTPPGFDNAADPVVGPRRLASPPKGGPTHLSPSIMAQAKQAPQDMKRPELPDTESIAFKFPVKYRDHGMSWTPGWVMLSSPVPEKPRFYLFLLGNLFVELDIAQYYNHLCSDSEVILRFKTDEGEISSFNVLFQTVAQALEFLKAMKKLGDNPAQNYRALLDQKSSPKPTDPSVSSQPKTQDKPAATENFEPENQTNLQQQQETLSQIKGAKQPKVVTQPETSTRPELKTHPSVAKKQAFIQHEDTSLATPQDTPQVVDLAKTTADTDAPSSLRFSDPKGPSGRNSGVGATEKKLQSPRLIPADSRDRFAKKCPQPRPVLECSIAPVNQIGNEDYLGDYDVPDVSTPALTAEKEGAAGASQFLASEDLLNILQALQAGRRAGSIKEQMIGCREDVALLIRYWQALEKSHGWSTLSEDEKNVCRAMIFDPVVLKQLLTWGESEPESIRLTTANANPTPCSVKPKLEPVEPARVQYLAEKLFGFRDNATEPLDRPGHPQFLSPWRKPIRQPRCPKGSCDKIFTAEPETTLISQTQCEYGPAISWVFEGAGKDALCFEDGAIVSPMKSSQKAASDPAPPGVPRPSLPARSTASFADDAESGKLTAKKFAGLGHAHVPPQSNIFLRANLATQAPGDTLKAPKQNISNGVMAMPRNLHAKKISALANDFACVHLKPASPCKANFVEVKSTENEPISTMSLAEREAVRHSHDSNLRTSKLISDSENQPTQFGDQPAQYQQDYEVKTEATTKSNLEEGKEVIPPVAATDLKGLASSRWGSPSTVQNPGRFDFLVPRSAQRLEKERIRSR